MSSVSIRGKQIANALLKQRQKEGQAGRCYVQGCKQPRVLATLKCNLCSCFYHAACAALPGADGKQYPKECRQCGEEARTNCLFCGLRSAESCFQCKRGMHSRCAWPNNSHPVQGSCGREKCKGTRPVCWPKPKDQQPPEPPSFSETAKALDRKC